MWQTECCFPKPRCVEIIMEPDIGPSEIIMLCISVIRLFNLLPSARMKIFDIIQKKIMISCLSQLYLGYKKIDYK